MDYPSSDLIQVAATRLGARLVDVYMFAAVHRRVPTDSVELNGFLGRVVDAIRALGAAGSGDEALIRGFVQARGVIPQSLGDVFSWALQYGLVTDTGARTGPVPAGFGYPPTGVVPAPTPTPTPTPAPSPAPTPTPAPAPGGTGLDLSELVGWARANPIAAGAVALAGYLLLFRRWR